MKWAGLILLVLGLGVSAWIGNESFTNNSANESEVFLRIWNEDLARLQQSKKLPLGWGSLRMVEYSALDQEVWPWIEHRKPNINIDPEGKFKLEILIDVWDDEEGKAALVEYHLIELSTENKVWELGRTFQIRDPK
jgi:hypothetical protein